MVEAILNRIEKRLAAIGISAEAASKLAGKSENLIGNMRKAVRNGRGYDPRSGSLDCLSRVLSTTPEWLQHGRGPEVVMADQETIAQVEQAKAKGRRTRPRVIFENIEGPFHVVDASISVYGDGNTSNAVGYGGRPRPPGSADLLGRINEAIASVYQEAQASLSLMEMGQIAHDKHRAILAACQDEDEYDFAIEIMKVRLRKWLESKPSR
jgi:hypothetical protein